jgi:hypothetical protein
MAEHRRFKSCRQSTAVSGLALSSSPLTSHPLRFASFHLPHTRGASTITFASPTLALPLLSVDDVLSGARGPVLYLWLGLMEDEEECPLLLEYPSVPWVTRVESPSSDWDVAVDTCDAACRRRVVTWEGRGPTLTGAKVHRGRVHQYM